MQAQTPYLDGSPAATLLGQCRFGEALSATASAAAGTPRSLLASIAAWHLGRTDESRHHAARWGAASDVVDRGPLVSIIIPTHDRRELLRRSLASVQAQLYRPLEVVVVNDAGQRVDDLLPPSGEDLRFRLVHNATNLYLARSRNEGLACARGEWVLCLDDDDLLYPHHVGHLLAVAQREAADLVVGVSLLHRRDGAAETISAWPSHPFTVAALSRHNVAPVQAVLFRRALAQDIGGFDGELRSFEDWDFWLRAVQHVQRAARTSVPTSCVDQRHQQQRMSSGRAVALWAHAVIERRHRALFRAGIGPGADAHHAAVRADLRAAAIADMARWRRVALAVLEHDPPLTGWARAVARALAPLQLHEEYALPTAPSRHAAILQRLLAESRADRLVVVDPGLAPRLPSGLLPRLALQLEADPQVAAVGPAFPAVGVVDGFVAVSGLEGLDHRCLVIDRAAAAAVAAQRWCHAPGVAEQWRALLEGIIAGGRRVGFGGGEALDARGA